MSINSIDLIIQLVMGFTIRKIVAGGSIMDPQWLLFVILLTACFLIIDSINISTVIGLQNQNGEKWYKLFVRNFAIVFTQKIIYF